MLVVFGIVEHHVERTALGHTDRNLDISKRNLVLVQPFVDVGYTSLDLFVCYHSLPIKDVDEICDSLTHFCTSNHDVLRNFKPFRVENLLRFAIGEEFLCQPIDVI